MITIKEVKEILNIKDSSTDKYIQEMIEPAIEFVRHYCGDYDLEVKGGVKIAVAKIIEFYMSNSSIASESISRISRAYNNDLPSSIIVLLNSYKKGASSSSVVKFY